MESDSANDIFRDYYLKVSETKDTPMDIDTLFSIVLAQLENYPKEKLFPLVIRADEEGPN